MPLSDYASRVDRMLRDAVSDPNNHSSIFLNDGPGHARIVINSILNYAMREVQIFCERLSSEVFKEEALQDAAYRLNPNAIRIITEQEVGPGDRSSVLPSLLAQCTLANKIDHRVLPKQESLRRPHMAIVDGLHLRLETDRVSRSAIVAFGNRKLARDAQLAFDALWQEAAKSNP